MDSRFVTFDTDDQEREEMTVNQKGRRGSVRILCLRPIPAPEIYIETIYGFLREDAKLYASEHMESFGEYEIPDNLLAKLKVIETPQYPFKLGWHEYHAE